MKTTAACRNLDVGALTEIGQRLHARRRRPYRPFSKDTTGQPTDDVGDFETPQHRTNWDDLPFNILSKILSAVVASRQIAVSDEPSRPIPLDTFAITEPTQDHLATDNTSWELCEPVPFNWSADSYEISQAIRRYTEQSNADP